MDRSQLKDFHPMETGLEKEIQALRSRSHRQRRPCEREGFLALLAGVPALRKTPGLAGPGEIDPATYFTTLPLCRTEADAAACRTHLERVFGIRDKESLLEFCVKQICCHNDYLDFEGFWEDRASFASASMEPENLRYFTALRDFSAQFHSCVGHQGYLAWDISECVGHLRAALACGLIDRSWFDKMADHWVRQAQIFKSWEEYAASLTAGALYWNFRQGVSCEELEKSLLLWKNLVTALLGNDQAWNSGLWYVPPREKSYCLWPSEMRTYRTGPDGSQGCIVSDQVAVEGKPVGWCYREAAADGFPDSGWRFFSGLESKEYLDDAQNASVLPLNSACNFDPDILPLLEAPIGSGFLRGKDGKFYREAFTPPRNG